MSCDVLFFFFFLSSKVILRRSDTCQCHSMKSKSIWANIANVGQSYFCKCLRVKDGNRRVFFKFRAVSWEGAAAVEAAIYFWRLTLKLTLGSASGPTEPTQQQSADFPSGVMDTLYDTDWGSRDTVSALMRFLWAHKRCCYIPDGAVTDYINNRTAGVLSKSQLTKYWSMQDVQVLILSSGVKFLILFLYLMLKFYV